MKKEQKISKKELFGELAEGCGELLFELIFMVIGCAVLIILGIDPEVVGDDGAILIGIAAITVAVVTVCALVKLIRRRLGYSESEPSRKKVMVRSRASRANAEEVVDEGVKKIIFDTDIGGDCDDAGALAIIHRAEERGLARLLALTVSTRDPWAPACADAINRYYGHTVPIGLCETAPKGDPTMAEFEERYGRHIAETFPHGYFPKTDVIPESAVRLMRKTLAENRGGKITMVVVGSCVNLAALLESGADDVSSLGGTELVNGQVDKVVLMGGCFADDGEVMSEYNIKTDIRGAKVVFEKCPVPIAVSHFDVGLRVMSGSRLMEEELKTGNPAAEAYRFHVGGKRHSWDPIAAFYAIYGTCGAFSDERSGRVTVDDEGVTRLAEVKGDHFLIDCHNSDICEAEFLLDRAMCGEIE